MQAVRHLDDVEKWRGSGRTGDPQAELPKYQQAKVPTVRVKLVHSVHMLPHQSVTTEVEVESSQSLAD